jgi:cyanophycin synthetase
MARYCPGSVTFFAADRHHPVMATHLAQGNRAVFVADGCLVAAQGAEQHKLPLSGVPVTHQGSIGFQVENVMAAVGAAWALGLDWNTIAQGLATFANDTDNALGRFNLFSYRGATVIADYGHNPDAILALVRAVENMPGKRRSVVISGAGDRRDTDIIEQTQILGAAFDEVVLYQDQCQRGRADGEVLTLLRTGLKDASRTRVIHEIQGEFLAIDTAMDQLVQGDLCLILVDQVDEALAYISARVQKA